MATTAQNTLSAQAEKCFENIIKNIENVRTFSTKNKDLIVESIEVLKTIFVTASDRLIEFENHKCVLMPTYAEAISWSNMATQSVNNNKTSHVVTIHPTDSTQINSEVTKALIKQTVNPWKLNVRVNKLKSIGRGGIIMECSLKEECDKIKDRVNQKLHGKVEAKIPNKKLPKMIIKNISADVIEDDILQMIFSQNPHVGDLITKGEKLNLIRIQKTRMGLKHAIIEVSPLVWSYFQSNNFLYISFSRCKVDEYNYVIQCYKCHGYGHFARECTSAELCANCGNLHKTEDCKSRELSCVNCIKFNEKVKNSVKRVNINHKANDKCCSSYKRIISIIKSKIDGN
jgi:hypothetical protein